MTNDRTGKTGRFALRAKADFSRGLMRLLAQMPLEEITVRQLCDVCSYPRSTFYNYFADIFDLMDHCWMTLRADMALEPLLAAGQETDTVQVFSRLYAYLDAYRPQLRRILSKNRPDGRCMLSLRAFLRAQIRQVIRACPGTKDFPLREDVMVDYYTATIGMLLEKCFFERPELGREDALRSVAFLLGTVEREAHRP